MDDEQRPNVRPKAPRPASAKSRGILNFFHAWAWIMSRGLVAVQAGCNHDGVATFLMIFVVHLPGPWGHHLNEHRYDSDQRS